MGARHIDDWRSLVEARRANRSVDLIPFRTIGQGRVARGCSTRRSTDRRLRDLKSRDEPEPTHHEHDGCDDRRDDQPNARQHDIHPAPAPLSPMEAKYAIVKTSCR